MNATDLTSIAPELTLTIAGCVLLLLEAFLPKLREAFTALALGATGVAGWQLLQLPEGLSFGGLLVANRWTAAASLVALVSMALCFLASHAYLKRERILGGEYHAMILWCATGVLLMLRGQELLTIFVSLELLSVCLYALAAYNRKNTLGSEAAVKYFLMGAFASAFVLYGIALLYGSTGSTRLDVIAERFASGQASATIGALGVLLLIAGFGFKMSLVPFHAWAPDTYQGAPTPFVAFLSVAPKAASVIVLIHVLRTVFPGALDTDWSPIVAALAALSMIVGNLLALVQKDIKRMLAYSGIGHMGYVLIPVATLDAGSWQPTLVYLLAYALMNAGAFALVSMLYARSGEQHLISELSGWGHRFPLLGACLTVCMLSLGGIPPTVGFLGKYLTFVHAVSHGQVWLALVGVSTSLIGVFYYLRVVYFLYMKDEVAEPSGLAIDFWGRTAAVAAALGILALGLFPARLLEWLLGQS
jgi:NADH-quinone oxidoreductase subunit N